MRTQAEWQQRGKLYAEGDKLYAEGRKLCAEGDIVWITAVIKEYGNVPITWVDINHAILQLKDGTREEYKEVTHAG